MTSAPLKKSQSQSKRFVEAARELGCEEDEAKFNAALGKVARHKPAQKGPQPHDQERKDALKR
jgi:hypothetical protein